MTEADVKALRADYIRQCSLSRWGEAAAVAVLLGFKPVASRREFARHVGRGGVDWDAVLAEPAWSTGELFLIASTAAMWSGRPSGADLSRVCYLDDGFYEAWLAIITAARRGTVPGNG